MKKDFLFIAFFIIAPFFIGYLFEEVYFGRTLYHTPPPLASLAQTMDYAIPQSSLVVEELAATPTPPTRRKYANYKIKDYALLAELAETEEAHISGLSGRQGLAENEGMMFLFNEPDRYGFWMRGMEFDLDFIWIRNGEIIGVAKNVKADKSGKEKVMTPPKEVDAVLEVAAGICDKYRISAGDKILPDIELE